jgi:Na+-transporting methylmalonyl-CoA/oxaloacetate decarboxylase gamma subunit
MSITISGVLFVAIVLSFLNCTTKISKSFRTYKKK